MLRLINLFFGALLRAEPVTVPSGLPAFPIDALPDEADIDVVRLVDAERATHDTVTAWAAIHR